MFGWSKKKPHARSEEKTEPRKQAYGIPTVEFDPAKVTDAVKADLRQNINSLKEIGISDFDIIYDAALRSISAGRDLQILYRALTCMEGMGRRRAKEISLSLNNKATALMQANDQERLGIDYATWLHSGAPCGSKEQDVAHRAASGKPYLVKKGMYLAGHWTWPGREDGCKCASKPLIAGLDGYAGGKPNGFSE